MYKPGFTHPLSGFTLVEVLVTLVIIAVITSLAYPIINRQLKHQESMQARSDLQNFLSTGRQFALIYQSPIHLCVANDNKQCLTANGSTLLTFIDKDNSNTYSTGDILLEIHKLSLKYAHLVTSVALSKPYIIFSAEAGRPTGYMGHIKYCPTDSDPTEMFKVTFSKTAVVKVKTRKEENTEC